VVDSFHRLNSGVTPRQFRIVAIASSCSLNNYTARCPSELSFPMSLMPPFYSASLPPVSRNSRAPPPPEPRRSFGLPLVWRDEASLPLAGTSVCPSQLAPLEPVNSLAFRAIIAISITFLATTPGRSVLMYDDDRTQPSSRRGFIIDSPT
jgi:hypothetical protein